MSNCKYYKQKEQVSYNDGITWEDVIPYEYRKGELYEMDSEDCSEHQRWTVVPGDYICEDNTKYQKEVLEVSNDNINYKIKDPVEYRKGSIIEFYSVDCIYKWYGIYDKNIYVPLDPYKVILCVNNEGSLSKEEVDYSYVETTGTGVVRYELTSGYVGTCVDEIGTSAFSGQTKLTAITISDNVTTIGIKAFVECRSLSSITIPDSVISIGDYAFQDCNGLRSLTIPSGVTSIGSHTFYDCYHLTSIEIPSGVTSIGDDAFKYCRGLQSVTVNSIAPPALGQNVFDDTNNCPIYVPCASLSVYKNASGWSTYANRITCISPYSDKLTLTYSGGSAYTVNCNSSTVLTSGETRHDETPFIDFNSTTAVTIGDCVEEIGAYAFLNYGGITSITIPSGITTISKEAFGYCRGLTSVNIPSGVTSIGAFAFRHCTGLQSVTVNATTPPTLGSDAFRDTNNCPIYVPCNSVSAYQSANRWSTYASRIQAIP